MSRKELHLQVFTAAHEHIGHVDGDEVYTREAPCRHVGSLNSGRIELLDGSIPYYFVD